MKHYKTISQNKVDIEIGYKESKQIKTMKQTAVEWLVDEMIQRKFFEKETELSYTTLEHLTNQAKEMEKEQQSKFTIDFINWLHLNQYKYNAKAKLYQKHFINETLFFSIDELFVLFKQQE